MRAQVARTTPNLSRDGHTREAAEKIRGREDEIKIEKRREKGERERDSDEKQDRAWRTSACRRTRPAANKSPLIDRRLSLRNKMH